MRLNLPQSVRKFRLGYPVQKDYPWPYTTLITAIFFTGLTVLFILMNIPLTAYEIATVDSSNPNATQRENLPMFFNMLPSSLQPSPGDFSPQTVQLGDTISTNMSIFNYKVTEIIRNNQSQSSFPWNNYALESCNVAFMTLSVSELGNVTYRATVSCWDPFQITLSVDSKERPDSLALTRQTAVPLVIRTLLEAVQNEIAIVWTEEQRPSFPVSGGAAGTMPTANLTLIVTPCCECRPERRRPVGMSNLAGHEETFFLPGTDSFNDHPSCSSIVPTKLAAIYVAATNDSATTGTQGPLKFYGTNGLPDATGGLDFLYGTSLTDVAPELNRVLHNMFQLLYHAMQTDLGVYTPSNMFSNPDMFQKTFIKSEKEYGARWTFFNTTTGPAGSLQWNAWPLDLDMSVWNTSSELIMGITSHLWAQLMNGTEASEMSRHELTTWAKVPRLSYVTPMFRMKSSASAAVSVFVATFAMLSASWKGWNLMLTFLAGLRDDGTKEEVCKACDCLQCMKTRNGIAKNSIEDSTVTATSHSNHSSLKSSRLTSRKTVHDYKLVCKIPDEPFIVDLEAGIRSA